MIQPKELLRKGSGRPKMERRRSHFHSNLRQRMKAAPAAMAKIIPPVASMMRKLQKTRVTEG